MHIQLVKLNADYEDFSIGRHPISNNLVANDISYRWGFKIDRSDLRGDRAALQQQKIIQETRLKIHLFSQKYKMSHSNPNLYFVHIFNNDEDIVMKFSADLPFI